MDFVDAQNARAKTDKVYRQRLQVALLAVLVLVVLLVSARYVHKSGKFSLGGSKAGEQTVIPVVKPGAFILVSSSFRRWGTCLFRSGTLKNL
jgi:hypothetical protein